MRRTTLRGIVVLPLMLAGIAPARSDITFGGNARKSAMSGAGLAVLSMEGSSTEINPAALALGRKRLRLTLPTVGLRASGISLGEAADRLLDITDDADIAGLARSFGERDSALAVTLNGGLRAGPVEALASGDGRARLLPNAALQTWARSDRPVTEVPNEARADFLAAAVYALPSIGFAATVSERGSPSRIDVGVRAKALHAVYSHFFVNGAQIRNEVSGENAFRAREMNGKDTLTRDGLSFDLGILVHPRQASGLSYALIVNNLIGPTFRFAGTDRNDADVNYELLPRSISTGAAWQRGGITVALDLVDISGAYGDAQARLGGEIARGRFALRAGYGTANGFTVGAGLGGFDLAYGENVLIQLVQRLSF